MNPLHSNSEDQVRHALKALADHDRTRESATPAEVVFARSQPSRTSSPLWFGSIGLAAAAMLVFVLRPVAPPPPPPPLVTSHSKPAEMNQPTDVAVKAAAPRKHAQSGKAAPREIATEFFALMDAPPPFERGQLVRVMVPAFTMREVGLPVRPERWNDRVQAELLVGEEGMAHAIRFVRFEQ